MSIGNYIKIGEDDKILLFIKNGYPVWDSKKYLRRFTLVKNEKTHLSKVYSDNYFFDGKDGYPNYFGEKDILINRGIYYSKIVEKYANPGKVLDVGCAAGFILKGFESNGWTAYGLEPNATMCRYGNNELKLSICCGNMENYKSDHKFDLVSLIQVVGHFYDIDKAFENISQSLKKNGLVLVESWDMNSLVARVLGRYWHAYTPPSVINWFSDESLKRLFNSYGYELIDSGYPKKQINLKHALSVLKYYIPNFLFNNRLMYFLANSFGKWVINYPPIDLKWYIFRKL
jgi:SAM-dependent methyltransferase